MRVALFQPDIPQNTGAMTRVCACLGIGLDIIEPCGFLWNEKRMNRSAMDYKEQVDLERHMNWETFKENREGSRLILMSTKAAVPYTDFEFKETDILLAGRESAGVPDHVHEEVDACVIIPMFGQARSMNVVNATSMILGEALRQTNHFTPKD